MSFHLSIVGLRTWAIFVQEIVPYTNMFKDIPHVYFY